MHALLTPLLAALLLPQDELRWWKGNTHTHTVLCGHADSTPEAVAKWYHDRGWNFLVLSEHNKFIDPATVKLPENARADFLLVPGEEITGPKTIHTTAFGVRELVPWGFDSSQKHAIVQNHVAVARAAGGEAIVNHPNFKDALVFEDLRPVKDLKFFELYNGHPTVFNFGSAKNPPTEVLWADLLDAGNRIYGVSSDDAHHFQKWAAKESNPGRGWIFVRAKELSTEALLAAMRAGDFYASSGVVLQELRIDAQSYRVRIDEAATARELASEILYGHVTPRGENDARAPEGWKIELVGPANRVLATELGTSAEFPRSAEHAYLRVRITRWRPAKDGGLESFYAWTQPAFRAEAESFPTPPTKKGLQVQMADDALSLGIRHAAFNAQLGHLLTTSANTNASANFAVESEGQRFYWQEDALRALDEQVRPFSNAGAVVYLILLARKTGDAAIDRLLLHPGMRADSPNQLGAFRSTDEPGREALRTLLRALARRYAARSPHGTVHGWIVGNEVNSHRWWYDLGPADLATVADAYERAVRAAHEAITAENPAARIYLSLEHHWNERYAAGSELEAVPGRALLVQFASLARERGDFGWHLAFHPYPENLFEPRTWLDQSATPSDDSARITFKNLEVLTQFLERAELRFGGEPRRVILSEQGFHAPEREHGERDQAAAFAYAWQKVQALPGIDALILHRHVDHAHEGGLNLGLWTRREGSVCTPERKRALYEVYRDCDGPRSAEALRFALPVIGVASWSEIDPLPR
ncbi:MAG: CehA/McbA family metallohydrolase [Planctomycetes bacterium]|nr:CehA/McbA family metallohydrolase [Planctomycetota bacterium]